MKCGNRRKNGILLAILLASWMAGGIRVWSQNSISNQASVQAAVPTAVGADFLSRWAGLTVRRISFGGIPANRLAPLPGHLAQVEGAPLDREAVRKSLHQLFFTGLYESVQVEGERGDDGVALVFRGIPRTFIGTVTVDGAKGATMNAQLKSASELAPGARFTPAKLDQALQQMRQTLTMGGFYESAITHVLAPHPEEQLVDIAFHVASGPQARLGTVEVGGDLGMSVEDFRRYARLRAGAHVDHNTGSRALAGVLRIYRKQQRLEAEIKLEDQRYAAKTNSVDFHFSVTRGPLVKVLVQGAEISPARIKRVIPVFEEGTVDEDLLNEGNRRLRDYYQRLGYFEVKVNHEQQTATAEQVRILYTVHLGVQRRVERVTVEGCHYFSAATLKELLGVHVADSIDRHGTYSQSLVAADVNALQAVYQNNGFSQVKITPETGASGTGFSGAVSSVAPGAAAQQPASSDNTSLPGGKTTPFVVVYHIEEGQQQRVGALRIEGAEHVDANQLTPLMNTKVGQLFSPQNLAGDRDSLWTDYMSRGFDQVRVEVAQQIEPADSSKVDVVFHITEGQQAFVRKVLLTGLHFTRPGTVAKAVLLHSGDPLNQTALLQTQHNLYDLALFNEVETAIENPSGEGTDKTVLIQAEEARRWALTYGFGFEAQTGNPQNNCAGANAGGVTCNPNGKKGVSPRVLADLTRNNLFGRELSASLRGNYGLLEQKIDLLFQSPHFRGNRNFGLTFSGGYANSLDVSTYVASKLETGVRWTEHFNSPNSRLSKANTFIYEFNFRRVKVDASSLQVYPAEIAQLSTAVRVAGPGLAWIRDTRDSPLDAHHGTYTSFQEFVSSTAFGSEVNFNRLDLSNSSYHGFGKGHFVLARNTRYGQERAFGAHNGELIPLPERLYAGGATSLRGFGQNDAGPRDPETGFPIGGAGALIESTELRLPPPTLPWLGNSVSVVLFHDMGNVFTNAGDAWASILRFRQPDRNACKNLTYNNPNPVPTGATTSTGVAGSCNFNYFSHAPGVGLRYNTPVGPIRLDFSYNLNPPIFPVNIDYSLNLDFANPHVGTADRFNFFFSLGQSF
jgi:outer membrane protein assembly complex protein YaeT